MRRPALAALLALAAACGSEERATPHPVGTESFVSQAPGTARGGTAGDPAAPAAPGEGADSGSSGEREIAEADLYARAGGLLLVQNAWRGLQIVDVTDPSRPRLRGKVPLTGTPVGLYLRGDVALVVASDHVGWALDGPATRAERGSRLWAIDVADPDAPAVTAELPLPGAVEETRLVGDVLYAVGRTSPFWDLARPAEDGAVEPLVDALVVSSFRVAEARAPAPVDEVRFDAAGWTASVNVTSERITVARAGWEPGAAGYTTRLTAVDASDPAGDLALGAETTVAGVVRDRWGLDLDRTSGTFRAVVDEGWNAGARLHVLAWATPGAVAPLAELVIEVPESLTAARFDGTRAYVVTAERIDPLWVIDLADPARPVLAGHLEMPGQLDFVEPRGERLLALGHTDEAGGAFQLQVSLLDVADPAAPALLDREIFGPDWGFVPARPDDLRKAFQVLDDRGLLLVPFQGFDRGTWAWTGGTQLLGLAEGSLAPGGFVPHAGNVKRAFPLEGPGLLAALSDERLQTIDAADLARPVELASLDLARPVWAIAVAGDLAAEVSGDPWLGAAELVVVPATDPDAPSPLARFPLAGAWARLVRVGGVAWALAIDPWTGASYLQALDLAGQGAPRLRGRLELPAQAGSWWWWGSSVALAGRALAIERASWSCGRICVADADVLVVDLGDPDAPRLAATVPLPDASWSGGLRAVGTDVWYTQYAWEEVGWTVRFQVGRIDLSDPAAPVLTPPVNVPGLFFSASDDGRMLYTEEVVADEAGASTWIHALELTPRATARLVGSARLPGQGSGAVRLGAHAYDVTLVWPTGPIAGDAPVDSGGWYLPRARLGAVALGGMTVGSVTDLPDGWGALAAAAGGKLFVSQGWPDPAMLVFGTADPASPAFERAVRTSGYAWDVVVEGTTAYLPSGHYGVTTIPLAP